MTLIEEMMPGNQMSHQCHERFGYVQRRLLEVPVRKVDCMIFSFMRRWRRRPRMTLEEVVKRDLTMNISIRIWSLTEPNGIVWSNIASFTWWDKTFVVFKHFYFLVLQFSMELVDLFLTLKYGLWKGKILKLGLMRYCL